MAGQDTKKLIRAGETLPISGVNGDFIYLKFADRPVDIIIGNSRVTMVAGDKYRPGQNFKGFEVENPDPQNPAQVIFTIGEGDFQTQTIAGQLNVVPSIIEADGTVRGDDRFFLDIGIEPANDIEAQDVTFMEVIERTQVVADAGTGEAIDGFAIREETREIIYLSTDYGTTGGYYNFQRYDLDTYALIEEGQTNNYGGGVVRALWFTSIDNDTGLIADDNGTLYSVNLATMQVDYSAPVFDVVVGGSGGGGASMSFSVDTIGKTITFIITPDPGLRSGRVRMMRYEFEPVGVSVGGLIFDRETNFNDDADHQPGGAGYVNGKWFGTSTSFDGISFRVYLFDENFDRLRDPDGNLYAPADFGIFTTNRARLSFHQKQNGRVQSVFSQGTNPSIYFAEHWELTSTITFRGRATNGLSAGLDWLFKQPAPTFTSRTVNVTRTGNGYAMNGEVIGLALELYLGKFLDAGYLDSVFGVEILETGKIPQWTQLFSGNESFQRAGVPDDLNTVIPGGIRLYVSRSIYEL